MPFKLDDASNLRFLYACLQTCDFPAIDYHKVAKQFGIQAPAARMRLRRLRDCLEEREGGSKMSKKQTMGDGRRGPRMGKKTGAKEGYEKHWNVVEDDDDDDEDIPLGNLKSRSRESGDGLKKEGREAKEDWRLLPESNPFLPLSCARRTDVRRGRLWSCGCEDATSGFVKSPDGLPSAAPDADVQHGRAPHAFLATGRNAANAILPDQSF